MKTSEVPRSSRRPRGPSGLAARGEGRPFIPPAELGGILEYFDKTNITAVARGEGVFYSLRSLSFEPFAYES